MPLSTELVCFAVLLWGATVSANAPSGPDECKRLCCLLTLSLYHAVDSLLYIAAVPCAMAFIQNLTGSALSTWSSTGDPCKDAYPGITCTQVTGVSYISAM